jgi:hypothetical protein
MESNIHKSPPLTPVSFNEENNLDSDNEFDSSNNTFMTIIEPGLEIQNVISLNDPNQVVHTKFISTKPNINDPNINANLVGEFTIYDHENTSTNHILMNQIKDYASKINCSDFHGKGTIDDYSELFKAASKIANESKQIQLDVDIEGFNEFSQAAQDLSDLFENFTLRLQNINIINDNNFLTSVVNALEKIWQLSESFGRFKTTILATTTIQFPKTAQETAVILNNLMGEINCAMNYITNFVNPTSEILPESELSAEEKNIILKAVDTIDNWNVVCEHGITIAMNNNDSLKSIQKNNQDLKNSATILKNVTTNLRNKLNNLFC